MPDREHGARQGRRRRDVLRGEARGEARVLHADLDRDRARHGRGQPEQLRRAVAEQVAEPVVQHHRCEHQQARRQHAGGAVADDGGHHQRDEHHRDPRQGGQHAVDDAAQQQAHDESAQDRQEHDVHDGLRHGAAVDGHVLAGQPQGEQRREQRGQERGHGGHGHGEGGVGAGEVADHVRGRAARGRAHEDHARRELGRQLEHDGDAEPQQRHDRVLRHHAQQHGQRPAGDEAEVRKGQRQAHAEHDDPEEQVDLGQQRLRGGRGEEAHERGGEHQQREDGDGDAGGAVFRAAGVGGGGIRCGHPVMVGARPRCVVA